MPFIAGAMVIGAGASFFGGRSEAKKSRKLMKYQLYLQQQQLDFAKQRWNHYRDTYGDIEKMMVADAVQGVQGDFAGVANRAREDVLAAGDNQQDQQRRQLQSYGIDPSSGRYVSADRRSGIQMATGAATAANNARNSERQYADNATRSMRMGVGQFGSQMMMTAGQGVQQAMQNMGQAVGEQGMHHGQMANNLFAQAGQMGMYGALQGAQSGLWGKAVEGVKGFVSPQPVGSTAGVDIQGGMNNAIANTYDAGVTNYPTQLPGYGGNSYAGTGYSY